MIPRTLFHIDAFTTVRFRGNPAGVVLGADGMTDDEMQDLARELKHSETAFVFRADGPDHDLRLRFFTPTTEVPSCGHATIAAHFARSTFVDDNGRLLRQKTGAGLQYVRVEATSQGGRRVVIHQGAPRLEAALDELTRTQLIKALALSESQLRAGLPIQVVSTGHSKVMVPLAAHVDLDAIQPDLAALSDLSHRIGSNGYFVFQQREAELSATDGRMFAPAIGIAEDPVTGNANGPLGAYIVAHGLLPHDGSLLRFTGHQGRALRREGLVHVEVGIVRGKPTSVAIAGEAVILFRTLLD